MTAMTATTVDVVLPCLDEAEALPWVLERIPPAGGRSSSTTAPPTAPPRSRRSSARTVVHEPRRGFGAACHAGLLAAEAEFVCFCDCDASLDPGLLRRVRRATVSGGDVDLVLGRRRPQRSRGLAPARPARQPGAGPDAAPPGPGCACTTSDRCGPPAARALLALGLTDRRSGYPLEMVVRAADAGWRVAERDVPYLPAHREVQGDRHLAGHLARRTRHAHRPRGTAGPPGSSVAGSMPR